MGPSLRLGTAFYGSAVLLERLLGLLLLPVLARALDRHDYGAWAQTAVAAAMLMPLVGFAFSTAIVRSFSAACAAVARRRAFVRLGAVVLGLFGLCGAAVLAAGAPVSALVYGDGAGRALLPALLLLLAAEVGVDFAVAWLRSLGRMGLIAGITALRSLLRYGVVLGLVWGGAPPLAQWLTAYAAVQAAAMAAVVALTWALLRRAAEPPAPVAVPGLEALMRFSAPLVLLGLFTQINAYVDRFLLVQVLGLGGLAVYAAAVSLAGIPGVVYSVLGFTLFPVLARHWHEGRRDAAAGLTSQSLQVFVFLALPMSLALALAGPALLPWVTTAEYRSSPLLFALLGVSVLAFGLYQITLYALLLDGRSRQVLGLTVAAAMLNAVLNLLLAPRLGATGAAAAAAVSNATMVVVASRLAAGAMPWRFPWTRLAPIAARTALAALPLAAWAALADEHAFGLLAAALGAGLLLHVALDLRGTTPVTKTLLAR